MIDEYNKRFNHKGLHFRALWKCRGRQVLYIYRIHEVRQRLCQPSVIKFLGQYGYTVSLDIEKNIDDLAQRFREGNQFPHELGIFLGYPLDEVISFIEKKGNEAIMCGEWKVYNNPEFAKQEFSKYECCRRCYMNVYARGFTMERLIIA